MSISATVCFAQSVCRFEEFGSSSFCDSWQWKIDAYHCNNKEKQTVNLVIRNKQQRENFSNIIKKVYEKQDGFFLQQVFYLADSKILWRLVRKISGEILLSYIVNSQWSEIILVEDNTLTGGHMAFEYLGHILPCCFLNMEILTFHGVLMEYKRKGIILSAPSGTGKTTHARLWRDYKNALILNGDRAVCKKIDNVWTGFGLPWSGTSGEQIDRSVPIQAIVIVERGNINRVSLIEKQQAVADILPHMQCPAWNGEKIGQALNLLDDFLCCIPVLRMQCRPEKEAVNVLSDFLEKI